MSGVATSFDDKFLLSGAGDGHLIVHRLKAARLEPLATAAVEERQRRVTALRHAIKYEPPSFSPSPDALVALSGGAEGLVGPPPQGFDAVPYIA